MNYRNHHVHPAFNTSLENKEMFNYKEKTSIQSFSLTLDDVQHFTFNVSDNDVFLERKARNGATTWQVTGKETMSIAKGRNIWRYLIKEGAIRN